MKPTEYRSREVLGARQSADVDSSRKSGSPALLAHDRASRGTGIRGRKGTGALVLMAAVIPFLVMVTSVAQSYQASSTRRFVSSAWLSYLAGELAEAAVAEAAHLLQPQHIFTSEFGMASSTDPAALLIAKMRDDQLSFVVNRSYRTISSLNGGADKKMMVQFLFNPIANPTKVNCNLTRKLARENAGVLLDRAEDLQPTVTPLTFRREYVTRHRSWFNWGVVRFHVKVRVQELRGVVTHELFAERRFTLRSPTLVNQANAASAPAAGSGAAPGAASAGASTPEILMMDSKNLRTIVRREEQA